MFPGAVRVLLSCGLLCAAGGGFYGRGMQAEDASHIKPAWEHVGPANVCLTTSSGSMTQR